MAVFTTAFVVSLGVTNTLLATVSALALNAAVGIGVSLVAKKLSGATQTEQTGGVQGSLQAGGDVARSILLGKRATAGSLVYANTWGKSGKTPNAYFTQVIALSDFPITGISAVWANGEPITIDQTDTRYGDMGFPVVEYSNDDDNSMWVKFYDGTQTVADPFLVNEVGSDDRPYQSTRVGVGVPYAIVTSQVNEELFTGFPTFKFELAGARLYDITKDSTAGGSGSHRWATPSTWGGDGDDLPAVQIYNILRGFTYNGTWLYGLQSLTAQRLPADDWIQQINKCRAGIDGPSGVEATYLTGLEVSVDTEIGTTIETLLTGCQGRLIESGGIYKIRVGEPLASVFAFGDGDILSTEEQSFTPFFGLSETINGVSATYPEPTEGWNTKTAPPLFNATYEAQDGARRLLTSLTMDMVYRSSQVQRIMKSALAEARRARRHTFVLPPSAWVLEPGDTVTFTSSRNGYAAKLFRVDGVADHSNLDVTIDITEVDPTDYDWNQGTDYKQPVFAPLGPVRPAAQPMYGWLVEPDILYDAAGNPWRPSIKVSAAPDQKDVRNVWVQVRLAATGALHFDSDSTVYADPYAWTLNGNFQSATNYEVRGKYVPISERATEWSGWLPVTTPTVQTDDLIVDLAHINQEVLNIFEQLGQETAEAVAMIEQLLIDSSLEGAVGQVERTKISAEVGDAKAQIIEERTVRVSADEALAQVSTELSASLGTVSANLTNEATVRATKDTALAQDITILNASIGTANAAIATEASARATADSAIVTTANALSATVGDITAQGLVKFTLVATPSGVDARFSVSIRANTGAAYKDAGFFLELYTTGGVQRSRFAVLADQFVVTDGATNTLPMVYEGGVLKLQNIRVSSLSALSAVLGNVDISNANIGNLQVQTSNIPVGAISVVAFNQQAGPVTFNPVYTLDVTINHGTDVQFVEINATAATFVPPLSGSTKFALARLYCVNDGALIAGPVTSDANRATMTLSAIHQPPARASTTYRIQINENNSTTTNQVASVVITAKAFKR